MTATLYPGRSIHASVRESVPNYALRRVLAVAVVAAVLAAMILTFVGLVGVVVDFGGRPAAASEIEPSGYSDSSAAVVRIHVAEPGDTLWSIADAHRGDVGRDRFIDALIDLNGGTGIQVGQAVRLP